MAAGSACPFIRLMAKDPGGLLQRNLAVLGAKCPHLSATGVSPVAVMASLQSQATPCAMAAASGVRGGALASACSGEAISWGTAEFEGAGARMPSPETRLRRRLQAKPKC